MSTPERITVADGKYTVINDNGKLSALRHGEPWNRDLTGDNLVYWMMCRIRNLEVAVQANHKHHEQWDEYDGYKDSELFDLNVAALKEGGLL